MQAERYIHEQNRILCIQFAKECLESAKKYRNMNMLRPAATCLKQAKQWRLRATIINK